MGIEAALIAAGVGAETAAALTSISTIFSGLSAASSLLGGMSAKSESKVQAASALAAADARGVEQERQAQREAGMRQEQSESLIRKQKLAYMKSGVTLEGSPLLVMEETRRNAQDDIDEILQSGKASADAARQEGRLTASQLKSSGRQQFMSGLTGAGKALESVFS